MSEKEKIEVIADILEMESDDVTREIVLNEC